MYRIYQSVTPRESLPYESTKFTSNWFQWFKNALYRLDPMVFHPLCETLVNRYEIHVRLAYEHKYMTYSPILFRIHPNTYVTGKNGGSVPLTGIHWQIVYYALDYELFLLFTTFCSWFQWCVPFVRCWYLQKYPSQLLIPHHLLYLFSMVFLSFWCCWTCQ